MNILHEFDPNRFVPGTMKKRVSNPSVGKLFPAMLDVETARLVVSGVTEDAIFDLPMHGDGVRRTAVQSWYVGGQLKFDLVSGSRGSIEGVLLKASTVWQDLVKGEGKEN